MAVKFMLSNSSVPLFARLILIGANTCFL